MYVMLMSAYMNSLVQQTCRKYFVYSVLSNTFRKLELKSCSYITFFSKKELSFIHGCMVYVYVCIMHGILL